MPDEERKGYSGDKTWSGMPLYECDDCEYSTLDEELMQQHIRGHGTGPLRRKRPEEEVTGDTDQFGNAFLRGSSATDSGVVENETPTPSPKPTATATPTTAKKEGGDK